MSTAVTTMPTTVSDPFVVKRTALIHNLRNRARESIIKIGQHLDEVRDHLARGDWLTWLEAEFGWSDQTAYHFIHVYEAQQSSEFQTVWNSSLPLKALYQLAAPKTPETAVQEVAERIEAGEKPSRAMVVEVIAKAKGVPAETDKSDEQTFQENLKTAIAGTKRKTIPAPIITNDTDADKSAEQRKALYENNEDADKPIAKPMDYAGGASVRAQVLADYFATTSGAGILNHIVHSTADRTDLVREFLDALGVHGLLESMSPALGQQLRAVIPVNPITQLRKMDTETAASTIFEAFGAGRADAIVGKLQRLIVPKKSSLTLKSEKSAKPDKPFKKTLELVATGSSNRSRH